MEASSPISVPLGGDNETERSALIKNTYSHDSLNNFSKASSSYNSHGSMDSAERKQSQLSIDSVAEIALVESSDQSLKLQSSQEHGTPSPTARQKAKQKMMTMVMENGNGVDAVSKNPRSSKKEKKHRRSRSSRSRSLSREASELEQMQDAVNRAHMESVLGVNHASKSKRSSKHHVRRSMDAGVDSRLVQDEAMKVKKKKSQSYDYDFNGRGYGSMGSMGSMNAYLSGSQRNMDERSTGTLEHPGVGQNEFDPRKELAYYASHYAKNNSSPHGSLRDTNFLMHSPGMTPRDMDASDHSKLSISRHKSIGTPPLHGGSTSIRSSPFTHHSDHSSHYLAESFSGSRRHKRGASERRIMLLVEQQVAVENAKGEDQPASCRDVFFVILFLFQLAAVIYAGITYGPSAMFVNHINEDPAGQEQVDREQHILWVNYNYIIRFAALCGVFAGALSVLALGLLVRVAENVIKYSLVVSIGVAFLWGTIGVGISPQSLVPLTGVLSLTFIAAYTFLVWDRIPFATANVHTALLGVSANKGLVAIAGFVLAITYLWCIWTAFALIGMYDLMKTDPSSPITTGYFVAMMISFYWTYQVLKYIVAVTVAGTFKHWWYSQQKDEDIFSSSVRSSFRNSLTYSFGSICFGSLFVGIVGIIRQIVEPFRPHEHASTLLCFQEFLFCFQGLIVSCSDSLSEVFNQWAMTYVGMHGYNFMKAGKRANILFEARGWKTIVNDDLYRYVLFIITVIIAGCTGLFGLLLEHYFHFGAGITSFHKPGVTAFAIGLAIGLVLSNIMMQVLTSALSSMFCCYAAGQVEFQKNHPQQNKSLRQAWKEAWPDSML